MTKIRLNGRDHEFSASLTIKKLLEELMIPPAGTAVAVNDRIVSRELHENILLKDGDTVEVIRAIGGG